MWNILAWIVIGGLAGWIASIIMGKNAQMGFFANILVGVVGGLLGGYIMKLIGVIDDIQIFNLTGFLVAIGGAVLLLFIVGLFKKK